MVLFSETVVSTGQLARQGYDLWLCIEKKMGSAERQPAGWRIQEEFLRDSSI